MEVMSLIAKFFERIITFPIRIMMVVGKARAVRVMSKKSATMAGNEVSTLTGGQTFVRGLGLILLYAAIIAAILGAFYGLWYLNRFLDLERQLGGPLPALRPYWLPILFGLFVVSVLLCRSVLRNLGPLAEPKDYADIHAAWTEAQESLTAADIELKTVPVFILLGRAAGGVGAVANASRLAFPVRGVPDRGDAPIKVFANPQGVYVACPGVGLLSELAGRMTHEVGPTEVPVISAKSVFDDDGDEDRSSALVVARQSTMDDLLLPDDIPSQRQTVGPVREIKTPQLLAEAGTVRSNAARLSYLGRLLAFHRGPFCGANGVTLFIPTAALQTDPAADQATGCAAADLTALCDGLGTDLPAAVVACDLETVPGAGEFLHLTPPDRRDRLLGLPFPPRHDLAVDRLPEAVAGTVRWTGGAIERMLLKNVRVGERPPIEELAGNTALYRFLAGVRAALPRLERVAARVAVPAGRPAKFAGAYLAATGAEPKNQAFLAGVFRILADNQNAVAWSASARTADAAYKLWSMLGYLVVGLCVIAIIVWAYYDVRGM